MRRAGYSEELAQLEEQIAAYFEGDPRTQAAFWTRAGETLAELGQIDEAVLRFGKAEAALPGHVPALEGWRQAALKGQLWIDVAEAATRQAAGAADDAQRAALYHFAGVALMDKALVGEQAMVAFRRALDADAGPPRLVPPPADPPRGGREPRRPRDPARAAPRGRGRPDGAASSCTARSPSCTATSSPIATPRRSTTARSSTSDPNDLRAHAAIADIAWEQGNWQEAADALMSRARLERQPDVLKTLCFRLGLIYADRLVDVPMALKAFQRALTYQPDDENTLVRLADLATQAGEWKLALGACERLVKNEHRSRPPRERTCTASRGSSSDGFGDQKRAERALNLALDGAPTNDEALSAARAVLQGRATT